ncbi:DUF4349 domain-containing protein [Halomicronema sp. CCY15110]|uniref:DUF4349 domain-containing protein n=1 Tax=Halomicronema sp. CCY15110 TaxID=2767773 RepID=UPI00194E3187|nr:DUF4349 domain-containing protein [Halomicronema sp. CCY15110]
MRVRNSGVKTKTIWAVGLLSAIALVGCSGAPSNLAQNETAMSDLDVAASGETASVAREAAPASPVATSNFQSRPQLIKQATLQLEMADVDAAIASVSTILAQHQGDLLQLSDAGTVDDQPRQVTLQLRVPQTNLEAALTALKQLGEVNHQAITAADVSDQLVDLQARVRNLRKSEESLLAIMERSGSIAEVLEVSRELSTIREAIERNDAQLQSLQNQVAYSTINLTLVSDQMAAPSTSPIGETLSQTWDTASGAMQTMSVGLLQLLLWLLAFSPYIGILVLSGWLGRRYWQQRRSLQPPTH